MLFRRLRWPVLGLLVLNLFAICGYVFIEGWSLFDAVWMVLISLTTIGYGEVHPLSDVGRAFTMVYITLGFGLVGYTFAQLTRYIVEGGLRHDLIERRRRIRMERLDNHVIVIGFGRLGREVVDELLHNGRQVCVVDVEAEVVELVPREAVHIHGDGAQDDTLREAGIERASAIAIATPRSTTNVYLTLAARQLNPTISIITRIDEDDAIEKARRAGADRIVQPFGVGGSRMAHAIVHPEASEFVEGVVTRHNKSLQLQDVRVGAGASTWHGSLKDLAIRQRSGVLVVAIRRPDGSFVTAPDPATMVGPDDVLVVVGKPQDVKRFQAAMD